MKKRLREEKGIPIGVANDKSILESIMYEVEYRNKYVAAMVANVIAENLFAQVDQEGNIFLLIEFITNTRTDGTQKLFTNILGRTRSYWILNQFNY